MPIKRKKIQAAKTSYYWQKHINGVRHYVKGLEWLEKRVKDVRLLEIYPVNPLKKAAMLVVYLERGIFYYAKFSSYEEAEQYVIQTRYNQANKEIHAT